MLPLWIWGAVGGFIAEVLRWYRVRESLHEGVPLWASDWKYWLVTLLMIGVGSLLVLMYQGSDVEMTPTLAVNVGASAPLIVSALLNEVPEVQRVESGGMSRDSG